MFYIQLTKVFFNIHMLQRERRGEGKEIERERERYKEVVDGEK